MKTTPQPFTLQIPDAALADLHERLARTRLPDEPPLPSWSTGTSLAYLRELIDYWRTSFDWRAWEGRLNSFPQFMMPISGIDLHFVRVPSRKRNAMPLLISHGWPGSVFELYAILPMLAEHFEVIAPSLPGYTLSFKPGQERFTIPGIAALYAELMERLGFARYGVQGGDWGAFVASVMGLRYPQRLAGIHLNLLAVPRDPRMLANTEEEKAFRAQVQNYLKEETGYLWIQGTRPQTLAFALTDSPAGLAAWIVEKFYAWTDNRGSPEDAVSRDAMLANISLYWFTGAIGSSFWPYYARIHDPWPISEDEPVTAPMGYAEFPREILRPPRSVAEKCYADIRRWTRMPRGGHFAALEQPEALAREVVAFFDGVAKG